MTSLEDDTRVTDDWRDLIKHLEYAACGQGPDAEGALYWKARNAIIALSKPPSQDAIGDDERLAAIEAAFQSAVQFVQSQPLSSRRADRDAMVAGLRQRCESLKGIVRDVCALSTKQEGK